MNNLLRGPVQTGALAALVAFGVALPAAAQDARFSFELGGARSTNSAIFDQTVAFPTATAVTRLTVDGSNVGAARIGYRITGPWIVFADLGQGSAQYLYTQDISATSFSGNSAVSQSGGAKRTSAGLAVAHRTTLASAPISIEPELGFAVQWLSVGNAGIDCVPQAPTLGGPGVVCPPKAQWEQTYSIPSVTGGLSLGYAIAPRIGVVLRGRYAVGRTSTEKGFYVDLQPALDQFEAPKSRVIHSTQLSLGFQVSP